MSPELVKRLATRRGVQSTTRLPGWQDVQIQWHPLVSQSTTLITNLWDASSLLQLNIVYEPGDHQRFQLGVIEPLGASGDEFGGLRVLPGFTSGGGTRLYVRYLYFF